MPDIKFTLKNKIKGKMIINLNMKKFILFLGLSFAAFNFYAQNIYSTKTGSVTFFPQLH